MKKALLASVTLTSLLLLSSCNSIESRNHFSDTFKGTYPGLQYNKSEWRFITEEHEKKKLTRIQRDTKRLYIVVDYPFSAILDTLAIPFDYESDDKKRSI